MSLLTEYTAIRTRLDSAINTAMETKLKDGLEDWIKKSAEISVYGVYTPKVIKSRRKENGGIIDPNNMNVTTEQSGNLFTLTLKNETGLQNLFGGNDTSPLVPIIEQGVSAYFQPFPRPFMDEANEMYVQSGEADRHLAQALREAGFEVIENG